jgi:hypothetical protein
MPDEIGTPTPADDAALIASLGKLQPPPTEAELEEVDRRCEAAREYRLRREQKGEGPDGEESD